MAIDAVAICSLALFCHSFQNSLVDYRLWFAFGGEMYFLFHHYLMHWTLNNWEIIKTNIIKFVADHTHTDQKRTINHRQRYIMSSKTKNFIQKIIHRHFQARFRGSHTNYRSPYHLFCLLYKPKPSVIAWKEIFFFCFSRIIFFEMMIFRIFTHLDFSFVWRDSVRHKTQSHAWMKVSK